MDYHAKNDEEFMTAVERLWEVDCALQAAIDTAQRILGPSGHVRLPCSVTDVIAYSHKISKV